jgi:SPW repeat
MENLQREVAMDNWTNAKFCDVANLILGAILFFSPWMFGFDAGKISENANIAGLVIAVLAIAALAAFAVWEEWLNLIVGLWVLVSPWVLGFQGTSAMTVHVIIGAAVAILAAIELWLLSQNPPRLTAGR